MQERSLKDAFEASRIGMFMTQSALLIIDKVLPQSPPSSSLFPNTDLGFYSPSHRLHRLELVDHIGLRYLLRDSSLGPRSAEVPRFRISYTRLAQSTPKLRRLCTQ